MAKAPFNAGEVKDLNSRLLEIAHASPKYQFYGPDRFAKQTNWVGRKSNLTKLLQSD